jgi:hypothetical protein
MTKEALKLALEALGWTDEWRPQGLKEEAITAIKEALANEALEKMAENARELGLDYEPAQRTWVGLTDEDKSEICDMTERDERDSVMRLVEAKLKARNI